MNQRTPGGERGLLDWAGMEGRQVRFYCTRRRGLSDGYHVGYVVDFKRGHLAVKVPGEVGTFRVNPSLQTVEAL